MGTEVLRPQDCLIGRVGVAPHVFPRRKTGYANSPKPGRRPAARPDQKKRLNKSEVALISKRSSSDDLKSGKGDGDLLMGQVTILRRGESLDSKMEIRALKKHAEMIACGTDRLGPGPEMVPKQIRLKDPRSSFLTPAAKAARPDMYAGSAFSSSPAPSSLPLPSFYKKKQISAAVDDSATRDLRRMLRLE